MKKLLFLLPLAAACLALRAQLFTGIALYPTPAAVVAPSGWVTNYTVTSAGNGFAGWVGCKLTPRNGDIVVTELGRWVISGNTAAHTVKIKKSGGSDMASVSIVTSGAPAGAFKYGAITPLTLTNGQTYYLVSEEVNGGDMWYLNSASKIFVVRWDRATCDDSGYSAGGVIFSDGGTGTNSCYGPVDFKTL